MAKPIPRCLERLPTDLDLRNSRGKPSALARLVLVIVLFHVNDHMFAWPGEQRLAKLTRADPSSVRAALRLLVARGALTRETMSVDGRSRRVWRVRIASTAGEVDPPSRVRFFWPLPLARSDLDQTGAYRALMRAFVNRSHIAIIVMLYQFARQPELHELADDHPACRPLPPNQAWIARALCTSSDTVGRVKRQIIERGLAVQHASGLLVFEDPARWAEILNCCEHEPLDVHPRWDAANGDRYCAPASSSPAPQAAAAVELALAAQGWTIADKLGHEIIAASVERWGAVATIGTLRVHLAGPSASFALEPLGDALGPEYHCPDQLIRSPSHDHGEANGREA